MKRAKPSSRTTDPSPEAAPRHVSIRAMYAEAMREVMADPRKALAEHDPGLAALLRSCPSAPHPEA